MQSRLLFRLLLLSSMLVSEAAAAASQRALEIYTWSDYIDPEIVLEFETEFSAQLKQTYFESDEERDRELAGSAGTGYDLIMVSGQQVSNYAKRKWILPLDHKLVPNLDHVSSKWRNAFDATRTHSVPYFWGTMGIAWRSDLYPDGFDSWKQLIEPAPQLSGKIIMSRDGRELLSFALKAEGLSVNTSKKAQLSRAGKRLAAQKPFVKRYGIPALDETSELATGDAWAAAMYNGDVLMLQGHTENIEFRLPDEGGIIWVDYLVVANSSARKELALEFLDFLNRPEVAARNAEYVYYSTPNTSALQYVSDDYQRNPIIHPTELDLNGSEVLKSLSPRSQKIVNTVITQLVEEL
ncbi:MAG: spermidine/putrescine transport system substrate-binding protein [Granulosicoccus sp.]|jgi:spermidine/putrescine transport system substrate-binding protein